MPRKMDQPGSAENSPPQVQLKIQYWHSGRAHCGSTGGQPRQGGLLGHIPECLTAEADQDRIVICIRCPCSVKITVISNADQVRFERPGCRHHNLSRGDCYAVASSESAPHKKRRSEKVI